MLTAQPPRPQPRPDRDQQTVHTAMRRPPPRAGTRFARGLRRPVGPGTVLAIVAGAVIVRLYVLNTTIVDGQSMQPTLHDRDRVLVITFGYPGHLPERGQIVVFEDPAHPGEEDVKRVVGLAGDRLAIAGDQVILNGQALAEPYVSSPQDGLPALFRQAWRVPEGHVFVLGDNRNHSADSRDWGPVPSSSLRGRALLVYVPWGHRRWLGPPQPAPR